MPNDTQMVTVNLRINRQDYGHINNMSSSQLAEPHIYPVGTTLSLTAVPESSLYGFSHWSTGSTSATLTVTLTKSMIITAYFYRKKNAAQRVATLIENLVNFAGLQRFWTDLKGWLALRDTTEDVSGASRIGYYNDKSYFHKINGTEAEPWEEDVTTPAQTVEDGLKSAAFAIKKLTQDLTTLRQDISENYNRGLIFYKQIQAGSEKTFVKVTADDVYHPNKAYYLGIDGNLITWTDSSAAGTTYDSRVKYYHKNGDPALGYDYFIWKPSTEPGADTPEHQFEAEKANLVFINNWYNYVVTQDNVYTKEAAGAYLTAEENKGGFIVLVSGYNYGLGVYDKTDNRTLWGISYREKYGQGNVSACVPILPNHRIEWDSWNGDGSDSSGPAWTAIIYLYAKGE